MTDEITGSGQPKGKAPMRCHAISLPMFGKCYLIPHLADDPPAKLTVGYVDFGDGGPLKIGVYRNGKWTDERNRPLKQPIRHWYHLEKPDGAPLF